MSIIKALWQEFIAAFRAERQGGEAAEASRRREDELRQELKEELEVQRIAERYVKAESATEIEAVQTRFHELILPDIPPFGVPSVILAD